MDNEKMDEKAMPENIVLEQKAQIFADEYNALCTKYNMKFVAKPELKQAYDGTFVLAGLLVLVPDQQK